MPIRVPSHLYRNQHGTFYFRLISPKHLRALTGQSEVRFSLHTEQRQHAIIDALLLIADLPRLVGCLQRMADNTEDLPADYFKLWRSQILVNAGLKVKITLLNEELEERKDQIAAMVERRIAQKVVKQAYTSGQLKGKKELEEHLIFPWPPEKTKPISQLLAAYLLSFSSRAKGGRKKPPGEKTLDGYETDIRLFITVMSDARIGVIDRDVAGEYFNILRQLPANMNRVATYRGKTIQELLAMKPPPQSEVNASKKMERLSGMFKWALEEKRRWGIDANPFTGFGQADGNVSSRRPFTHAEFQLLLNHPTFAKRQFPSAYSFWLIPLATFTGARLGELAQLELKDFVDVDGIACIDINDTDAVEDVEEGGRKKRVKTKNAKRLVPIHPELIRLGLLRYVEAMLAKKQVYSVSRAEQNAAGRSISCCIKLVSEVSQKRRHHRKAGGCFPLVPAHIYHQPAR